jgi:hypothetical protein
MVAPIPHHWW